jgi:hypothetical protein
MALLGSAALAMFWHMDPAHRAEFEEWHSREHFPERMRVPGFLRGSRWVDATGEGFFVMYEVSAYETLTSAPYLARLNDPTPWSVKMMPRHRDMVRSQCRVVESAGSGIGGSLLAVRLPAAPRVRIDDVAGKPGITGAHLLENRTPAIAPPKEQAIRGHSDRTADWILVVMGHDRDALRSVDAEGALYRLQHAMTPDDLPPR